MTVDAAEDSVCVPYWFLTYDEFKESSGRNHDVVDDVL